MKKLVAMVLSLSFIISCASAAEVSANSVEDEIISTMIIVNERAGMQLSKEQISELRGIVKMSAKRQSEELNISLNESYMLILEEINTSLLIAEPSEHSETEQKTVVLPKASTGDIFYTDNGIPNHVGIYVENEVIVESMPTDGVQRWRRTDKGAWQVILVDYTSPKGNNSCILSVNTTSTNRAKAASWAKAVPVGTPYDLDFVDNKSDYYYTYDGNVAVQHPESDKYNCSELVWKAYKKAASIDLDSNGGLGVYPNDIRASSLVAVVNDQWKTWEQK